MTNGEWIGVGVGAAVGVLILRELFVKPKITVGEGTITGPGAVGVSPADAAAYEASKQCECQYGNEWKPCPCDEAAAQLDDASMPLGVVGAMAAAQIVGDERL